MSRDHVDPEERAATALERIADAAERIATAMGAPLVATAPLPARLCDEAGPTQCQVVAAYHCVDGRWRCETHFNEWIVNR